MVHEDSSLPSSPRPSTLSGAVPGLPVRSSFSSSDRLTLLGGLGLALVFLALSFYLLRQGIRVQGDGLWYVACAEQLRQGQPLPELARSRLCYVYLIACSQASGLGLAGVVALHLALAVIATLALFDLASQLAGPVAGLLAAALFVANPDIVRWHAYILTDSLYISVVVLATWFTFQAGERGRLWYVAAVVVLLGATLLRPNGWLFVLIAPCYWLFGSAQSGRVRLLLVLVLLCAFVSGFAILLTARPRLLTNSPYDMLRQGEVIWGYPEGRLAMPNAPTREQGAGGIREAVDYTLRHPLACLHLAALRVFTELAHTRPFYSQMHNTLILVLLPPLYAFSLVGLVCFWRQPLAWLLVAIITAHLLIQAANYADWDGRFLLYIFPLIGVLSSAGLITAYRWLRGAGPALPSP